MYILTEVCCLFLGALNCINCGCFVGVHIAKVNVWPVVMIDWCTTVRYC